MIKLKFSNKFESEGVQMLIYDGKGINNDSLLLCNFCKGLPYLNN